MFNRILVLCDGNICRSPTVAALLQRIKPDKQISSAGLVGLEGHDMDVTARTVAQAHGLICGPHTARKLTAAHCREADLILVMESRQRDKVIQKYPEASGKVFLLTHWQNGRDIPDPYKRGQDAFELAYTMMNEAVKGWENKL